MDAPFAISMDDLTKMIEAMQIRSKTEVEKSQKTFMIILHSKGW